MQVGACARACEICADEYANHNMEHCKLCETMCRECAEDCRKVLGTVH